jgi:hypothetical protein
LLEPAKRASEAITREATMGRVAVVMVLTVAAITASTLILDSRHERTAVLGQVRAEHEELIRRMSQMEQMLMSTTNREGAVAPARAELSMDAAPTHDHSAESATADQRAAHEEGTQAGNALVDNAIAAGAWNPSDFGVFVSATRNLSVQEQSKMLERLTTAINANRVRIVSPLGGPE